MDITLVSFVLTSILTVAIATANEKPVEPVVSAGVRSVVTPNVEIWSGREGLVASGKIGDIQGGETHHDIGLGAYGPPGIGPQSYESGEQHHHRRGVEQSYENGKHRQKQPFYPPPEFNNHHHGGGGGHVEQHHGIENYPRERQSRSHSREYGYPQEKSHRRHAISGETYGEYERKRSSSSSSSSGSSSHERSYHEEDRNSHKLSDDGNQYGISDDDDCDYVIIRRGSQQRHEASRFASRKHERHHHQRLPTKTVKIRCKSKKRHHHSNKSHKSYPKSEVITLPPPPPPTTTKKPTTTIAPTTQPPPPPTTTNKPKSCPPSRKCPSYPRRSSASHSKSVEVRPCPHQQPCMPSSSHHSKSSSSEEHACPPPPPCPGNATSSHPKEKQDQHHHKSSSSSSSDSHHDDYKPSPAKKESSEQVHSKDSLERWKSIKRNKSESKSIEKKSHSASDEALSKWKPIYQLPKNYQQHRKSKSHSASKEASKSSSSSHSDDNYSHLSKDNGCGELNLSDHDIEWLYRLLAANDLDKFFRFVEHKIYKRITRSSQRALHKLASVYSPNDDAKLFDMFKNSKYREIYQFLSKKHVSKHNDGNENHYSSSNAASSKSVLAALENEIYTVFGRVLIDRPAEKGHYFEVQNALLAAVIIVW